MNDNGDPLVFSGVSATPNVATRLFGSFRTVLRWATAWAFDETGDTWAAWQSTDDADPSDPSVAYFR
ncbi:MAG: hypothetical protein NVSMB21_11550 [Vulcanimicrobiaceae bacterium]